MAAKPPAPCMRRSRRTETRRRATNIVKRLNEDDLANAGRLRLPIPLRSVPLVHLTPPQECGQEQVATIAGRGAQIPNGRDRVPSERINIAGQSDRRRADPGMQIGALLFRAGRKEATGYDLPQVLRATRAGVTPHDPARDHARLREPVVG
jgi:hypothetical protein